MKQIIAFFLIASTAMAQTSAHIDSIASTAIGTTKRYAVLLPRGYDGVRRFPVLYLLHGHDGGHLDWLKRTDVEQCVRDIPVVVVFPEADNSWYVNSWMHPEKRYEEYMVQELRPEVERVYRIDTTRRAIAGLSMGGYGALLYALKYPGMFHFAGSLSGAFIWPRFIEDTIRQPASRGIMTSLRTAFGATTNPHRDANDVYLLFRSVGKDTVPYIYLAAGIQDGFTSFLWAHRVFTDSLRSIGARYEYHEVRGGHSWAVWGREIKPMIQRLRQIMNF